MVYPGANMGYFPSVEVPRRTRATLLSQQILHKRGAIFQPLARLSYSLALWSLRDHLTVT